MAIPEDRVEQFEAEVRRRISAYLEHRRDTAPDGPGLEVEDYAELERGFAGEILREPGWEDLRTLWKDADPGGQDADASGRPP